MLVKEMAGFEYGAVDGVRTDFLCVVEGITQVREEKREEERFYYEDFNRQWF